MLSSDIIYVSLKDPDKVMAVLTEASGGAAFLGALCERGLFPEAVWRKAMGDTSGGMHCWPPASTMRESVRTTANLMPQSRR